MKAKVIDMVILNKINDWIDSIDDSRLKESLRRNVIVTGGCITSMLLKERVNDFDVYLASPHTAYHLARYYLLKSGQGQLIIHTKPAERKPGFLDSKGRVLAESTWNTAEQFLLSEEGLRIGLTDYELQQVERVELYFKSSGYDGQLPQNEDELEAENLAESEQLSPETDKTPREKYKVVFSSSNAITLSDKIQIVLRFTGSPEEIHKNYDFVHTTNYWTRSEGLVCNVRALQAVLARELIYTGSRYPLASILRTRKFIKRGWSCHVGNYIKMALQLNELDLFNPTTLRDQLTGVDMAYMMNVISAVETKVKENPDFNFNAKYLCELVDRLMGETDPKE